MRSGKIEKLRNQKLKNWKIEKLKRNIDLQRVAGQDDGLLVVAAQAAVHHVHLQLQEVVVPEVNISDICYEKIMCYLKREMQNANSSLT